MASAVKTNVTELPESRVRVEAEVPADEVQRRVDQAARALGRQLKIPGFRRGKVPAPIVLQRVGRETVLDEAVRGSLGGWYVDAIDAAGVIPVGDPQLSLGELPAEGEPLTFSIEIGVRPTARLGEYKGLEAGRREPQVTDEAIEHELEALRERVARLETVDGPAAAGDFAVVDLSATVDGEPVEGADGRDELVELGAGRLPAEIEQALVGSRAGDERTADVAFPADHPTEQLQGKTLSFSVVVKEVKRKVLPELDDEFASDAAGFDTLDELRDDIAAKLREADEAAIEAEFREAAVDAAVAEARVDVPDGLVTARAEELWRQLVAALARQGISEEAYLRIAGKTREQIVDEAKPEAEQALKREAVLAAVVDAESIEPSEEDLLRALERSAEREGVTPEMLLGQLRDAGRTDALARDVATRLAVDVIAASAQPISLEQAQARDKLWTPEKEETGAGGAGRLWTPGR